MPDEVKEPRLWRRFELQPGANEQKLNELLDQKKLGREDLLLLFQSLRMRDEFLNDPHGM